VTKKILRIPAAAAEAQFLFFPTLKQGGQHQCATNVRTCDDRDVMRTNQIKLVSLTWQLWIPTRLEEERATVSIAANFVCCAESARVLCGACRIELLMQAARSKKNSLLAILVAITFSIPASQPAADSTCQISALHRPS
jgi:hypothetical protein